MRLSTERDRDEGRAIAVLHAAFDAGISLLDTADAYCFDDTERGHNERLIARALQSWISGPGDRSRIRVATKGGLIRPDGRWEHDGRAKHLRAACEASLVALGADRIDLYQLHAPDPAVPLSTSVRALAGLKRDGLVESIGLCNVTVGQIEQARRIVEIDAVQVEFSLWHEDNVLAGVVPYCVREGIQLLAYRPLGGPGRRHRAATDPTLREIASRHDVTPEEAALAWLRDLSNFIVPLPGATRLETVASISRVPGIALTDDDREQFDLRFPAGRMFRRATDAAIGRATAAPAAGEIVLVMGLPAAGKSTVARSLAGQSYHRLNRDEAGGTLRDLVQEMDRAVASGVSRIVLDNTYVSRKSRAEVVRAAAARGIPVRCLWLTTDLESAQVNAATRIVTRYGRLPDEAELKTLAKRDPAAFPPGVLFRYQRELEPPHVSEGFSRIDTLAFERRSDASERGDASQANGASRRSGERVRLSGSPRGEAPRIRPLNRAVIVWCDNILLRSATGRRMPLTPDDVEVPSDRGAVLRRLRDEGWRILGLSWLPEIAEEALSPADATAVFDRMRELLQVEIEIDWCPHAAGPPRCWCRKPLPGLGVLLIHRHQLDPARCVYVGSGPQDPGFARKLGFTYAPADEFFAP
jgi:aryl-alcohol dehydrogenase-like predicted oxidoreductase/predicted kinase